MRIEPLTHTRGSMTLIAVFLYVLFAALGLGLLLLSQVHLKISAHTKSATLLDYAAENGIKYGYARLAAAVARATAPVQTSDPAYAAFLSEIRAGRLGPLGDILSEELPLRIEGMAGGQSWAAASDFAVGSVSALEDYSLTDFAGTIRSEGRLGDSPIKAQASLDLSLKILAGRIPLSYFPFLLARSTQPGEREAFLASSSIRVLPAPGRSVFPPMSFTDDTAIPPDSPHLLRKALKTKIFSPDRLSRAELRSALGLDMVDEPVPDGVYLIHSDAGLGGVFVQGDLDLMVLAVDADSQVVFFKRGESVWTLRFNPSQRRTSFLSPAGLLTFDRVPLGIILVNGRIRSFGGGTIDSAGEAALAADESVACLLQGVSLTVVCSDQVTLSSHLVLQGVKWLDGIPYLKDATSQLVLYAGGRDFVDETARGGKIIIAPEAPRNLKLQASLTARTSIEIQGATKDVSLAGGLQTGDVVLGQSSLTITPDDRLLEGRIVPENAPLTARPVFAILALRPLQWSGT